MEALTASINNLNLSGLPSLVALVQKHDVAAMTHLVKLSKEKMTLSQPLLIAALPCLLESCGDKKASSEVKKQAEATILSICSNISPNAVSSVLPILFNAMGLSMKWQTRAAALKVIRSFGGFSLN